MSEHVSSSFVKAVSKHSISRAMLKFDPTRALIFGDAMHTYFEDRLAFVRRFVVFDDTEIIDQIMQRRPEISVPSMTKEYKSFKSEFEHSLNEGQTVITQHEMDSIEYMYRSAVDNTGLQSIYQDHAHDDIWDEYSFLTDKPDHHGLLYRVRPDRLLVKNDEPQVIIDWKSCRDASEKAFRSSFWKFRYDLQAAFYCSILEVPMDQFFYVAIEKEFPYNSAVFSIDEDTQMRAMRELELIKERIGEWKENPSPETSGLANANTITYL